MTVEAPPRPLDDLPDGSAKIFGMENFGNTCYCNSVLQCLYYSKPFREHILAFPQAGPTGEPVADPLRKRRSSVVGQNPHPFAVDPAAALSGSGLTAAELQALQATLAASSAISTTASTIHNSISAPTPTTESAAAKSAGRRMSLFGRKDSLASASTLASIPSGLDPNGGNAALVGSMANFNQVNQNFGQVLDTSAYKQPPYPGLEGISLGVRFPGQNLPVVGFTEDPFATPETRKRAALIKGPIVNLDLSMASDYSMSESLFTSLKDIFESMAENTSRTGVVSPSKLIEVLKRENELFRSSMHQDAHEFFNFLLNEVIENVDRVAPASGGAHDSTSRLSAGSTGSGWVHELFEGLLTSETKCLTCETVSRRDEKFLDLSIDLERNTSITSCLRQFSASEMLCERNKFHCDPCGGLQEAEKRMKVKRLPKILALHLKRFKFTEDMQRNVKLFHRVLYPKHFRLFNTTFDAEDPDKLYELCAVVVHIGGGPYHGHYVSVIKTEHAGWMLFDDEMVESVDQNYVFNFFGDNKGMATAYVLFYQEISPSQMEKENLYANDEYEADADPLDTEAPAAMPNIMTASVGSETSRGSDMSRASVSTAPTSVSSAQRPSPPPDSSSAYTHLPEPIAESDETSAEYISVSPTTLTRPSIPIPRSASVSVPSLDAAASSISSTKSDLYRSKSGTKEEPKRAAQPAAPVAPKSSPGAASPSSSFGKFSFGRKSSKKRKDEEVPVPAAGTPTKSRGLSLSFKK